MCEEIYRLATERYGMGVFLRLRNAVHSAAEELAAKTQNPGIQSFDWNVREVNTVHNEKHYWMELKLPLRRDRLTVCRGKARFDESLSQRNFSMIANLIALRRLAAQYSEHGRGLANTGQPENAAASHRFAERLEEIREDLLQVFSDEVEGTASAKAFAYLTA